MKTRLKRLKNSQFLADRLTLFLAVIAIVVTTVCIPLQARGDDGADSVMQGYDTTITHFSKVMSQAYNDMLATSSSGGSSNTKKVISAFETGKVGIGLSNVGNYLGIDAGSSDVDAGSYSNAASGGTAANVRTITVNGILGFYGWGTGTVSATASTGTNAICQYVILGSALRAIGVDEVKTAEENSDGIRKIIGYGTYVAYTLAYSANGLVENVVTFMQSLNPFYWLDNTLATKTIPGDVGGGVVTGTKDMANVTTTLASTEFMKKIAGIYKQLKTWRFAIMGLMIVILVASITVFKSKSYNAASMMQQKFKNLLIRLIIMFIGVPLCFMMFNEGLSILGKYTNSNKNTVSAYIMTTYASFEDWAVAKPSYSFMLTGSGNAKGGLDVNYKGSTIISVSAKGDGFNGDKPLDSSALVSDINVRNCDGWTYKHTQAASKLYRAFSKDSSIADTESYSKTVKTANEAVTEEDDKKLYDDCRQLLLNYASGRVCARDALDLYAQASAGKTGTVFAAATSGAGADVENDDGALISSWISQLLTIGASGNHLWSMLPNDMNTLYTKEGAETKWQSNGKEITVSMHDKFAPGAVGLKCEPGDNQGLWSRVLQIPFFTGETPNMNNDPSSRGIKCTGEATGDGTNKDVEDIVSEKNQQGDPNNCAFKLTYDMSTGGMAPLALYNYLCTYFHDGVADVYTPDQTSNAGVNCQHYAVIAAYSGFAEYMQILFAFTMLASLGAIAWVYAMSLMMNIIVEIIKVLPTIFKMLFGSIQGFVEALLTVFSILVEIFITILFYDFSMSAIDFVITGIRVITKAIINLFGNNTGDVAALVSSGIAIAAILWATYQLIVWRKTIVIAFKSIITHTLNQVFGTNAQMPTGASSGMLKGAAMLGAGAVMAHGLAQDGSLGDVVNDLTGTDIGNSVQDAYDANAGADISNIGDGVGGLGGGMDRGRGISETEQARQELEDGANGIEGNDINDSSASMYDEAGLTDEQEAAIGEKIEAGDFDGANELRKQYQEQNEKGRYNDGKWRDSLEKPDSIDSIEDMEKAAAYAQAENAEMLGDTDLVTNNGVHGGGMAAEQNGSLSGEKYNYRAKNYSGAPSAYEPLAEKYDANGLTAEQAEAVSDMVENGASETEVAAAVDGYAQQNFGNSYAETVDSINRATGRGGAVVYGNMDSAEGNARTMSVGSQISGNGLQSYTVQDATSANGPQQITVGESTTANGVGVTSVVNAASGEAITTVDASRAQTQSYGDAYTSAMNTGTVMMARVLPGGQTGAQATSNVASQMMVDAGRAAGMDKQTSAGMGVDTISYNYVGGNGVQGSVGGTDTVVNYQMHGADNTSPGMRGTNTVNVDVYSGTNSNGAMQINANMMASQYAMQKAQEFLADTPETDPNAE